ncbi:uncharacterized protein [Ptychodera flava]|uniref:uncharacterized protein n=1 Tax=Ptychodera flava TaxID=63121 RepID=UPI00396A02D5
MSPICQSNKSPLHYQSDKISHHEKLNQYISQEEFSFPSSLINSSLSTQSSHNPILTTSETIINFVEQTNCGKCQEGKLCHEIEKNVLRFNCNVCFNQMELVNDKKIKGVTRPRNWLPTYTVMSFLMSGQYHKDYSDVMDLLGLPKVAESTFEMDVNWLFPAIATLCDWSCSEVQRMVKERGDEHNWEAVADGFYGSRRNANNSSFTLHDLKSGKIAFRAHRTKLGQGHNWEGTSAGAEGDMFSEICHSVKASGITISRLIADKDAALGNILVELFPEAEVTYCSNHVQKTLYGELANLSQVKCKCNTKCKRFTAKVLDAFKESFNHFVNSEDILKAETRSRNLQRQ